MTGPPPADGGGRSPDRDGSFAPDGGREPADEAKPQPERYERLRAFLYEMFDRESVAAVDEYCTESFRLHDGGDTSTRSELKENLRDSGGVFAKRVDSVDGFAAGDWAAAHFVRTYEQREAYLGTEPDGQAATFTATLVCRFDGDRIDEMWVTNDDLSVLEQLGVVDPPGGDSE